jgi:hypothetical protein
MNDADLLSLEAHQVEPVWRYIDIQGRRFARYCPTPTKALTFGGPMDGDDEGPYTPEFHLPQDQVGYLICTFSPHTGGYDRADILLAPVDAEGVWRFVADRVIRYFLAGLPMGDAPKAPA